jgi:hypothetical protein
VEAKDSWDESHHILAHVKIILKCFLKFGCTDINEIVMKAYFHIVNRY